MGAGTLALMQATKVQLSKKTDARLGDRLFAALQLTLPTHLMSRVVHWFLRLEIPWLKNLVIGVIMRSFGIQLEESVITDARQFRSFNDFFTRELKPGRRPMPEDANAAACPVDGFMYQHGNIESGRIFQAKGQSFDLVELLGGDAARAASFQGGQFATIYLAPSNYHRIHMPLDGRLREMVYVPGRLFSVNPATSRAMPNLFARNERVAALFETSVGPMAMVLVGALFVGSIETVWAGEVTPPNRSKVESTGYPEGAVTLMRGEEMGRFNMGSTVILLFGPNAVNWASSFETHQPLRMGETLALPR
ncbi:MAG: archaetidylserine decarboxylase [Nocardiaceae bacterium]|nr:archaetidylserine decarboxylase [Nocardiaceae bacterium]